MKQPAYKLIPKTLLFGLVPGFLEAGIVDVPATKRPLSEK